MSAVGCRYANRSSPLTWSSAVSRSASAAISSIEPSSTLGWSTTLPGNGQYFTPSGSIPAVSAPWVPPSTQSNPACAAERSDDISASLLVDTTSSITSKPAS